MPKILNDQVQLHYYHVRKPDDLGWGNFIVGSNGLFVIHSDYESGVFRWTAYGDGDFRIWLLNLLKHNERDYVYEKVFPLTLRQVFNGQATYDAIKNDIIEERDNACSVSIRVEEELELLDYHAEHECFDSEFEFFTWLSKTSLDDAYYSGVYELSPTLKALWRDLIPLLINELEKDLATEAETTD